MKLLLPSLMIAALLQPDGPPQAPVKVPLGAAATYAEGFSTPESVLYDAAADVYLVSNINGNPVAKDNNGYVAVVSPEGKGAPTRLIEGGKNGVTLHAPKGMVLVGETITLADIDTVRMFDRKTGKPTGELAIPNASFLNGIAAAPDGTLYVTDSGLGQGKEDLEGANGDAIYAIKGGKLTSLLKEKHTAHPNGIVVTSDGIWTVSFGSNELWALDPRTGKKSKVTRLPKGRLDGLVALPTGELLITSWEGEALYRGKPGGPFKVVVRGLSSPAGLGFDSKRSRALVPRFNDHRVEAYNITAPSM